MKVEKMSWSRENRFNICGQQFAYVYGEGLKRPPGVAMIRGLAPHKSVEADLKAKLEDGALLPDEQVAQIATDYIDQRFKGEVAIDGEFQGMTPKEAKTIAREDARKMALRHHEVLAPRIRPTALEMRVVGNFPNALPVPYEGVIDIVDDDRAIRDVKTKRKAPSKNDAHESEQLTRYQALHFAETGRFVDELDLDFLWVTPGGKLDHKVLDTTRTEEDIRVGFERTLRVINAIEKDVYLPAPVDSWACSERYCGFTGICPYFAGRPRPTT